MAMSKKSERTIPVKSDGNAVRAPQTGVASKTAPKLTKVLEDDAEAHRAKIERIKKEVADGTYAVDSRSVAEALIKDTLDSAKED
jgi:anti-sigma28 factor (negative regulator of flagellin synthesis)